MSDCAMWIGSTDASIVESGDLDEAHSSTNGEQVRATAISLHCKKETHQVE